MKKLGTALRLIALIALIPAGLTAAGAPQPQQDLEQMSCGQYCRTVCIANGETCCFSGPNTCGCC
jgi:hypothetical protein